MSLHVSSAPHVHSKDSTQTIMRDVLIAMLPTTVMGVYAFGFNAHPHTDGWYSSK